jgi:mRNA interferase RelE/StbE
MTPAAQADLAGVPTTILARMESIVDRLERWPNTSGARPLRGEWNGHHRIRTGDWRVIFRTSGNDVTIVRVMHRSKVYER